MVTRKKALIENIGSLTVLQAANYLFPLVTLPYLVRVLGADNYGQMVFAQAFAGYFMILTDYGFNLTATRQISINRHRPERVAEIFGGVMVIKTALLFVSGLVFTGAVLAVPQFRAEWAVHLAAFAMVVGAVAFPTWFFQGIERMKYITVANVVSKGLAAASIFIFVRHADHYVLATFLQSAGFLLAGAIGLVTARKAFRLVPRLPELRQIRTMLVEGWHVFVSQASVSLFGNTNVFVLGLFAPSATVGQFAVAEKIVRAVVGLSIPISNAIFPTVSSLFQESREAALAFLRRMAFAGGLGFLGVSVLLFLTADVLTLLVAGEADATIALLIRIMAILPFTVFMDNVYGTQILLNIGRERQFVRAVLVAGLFSLGASLVVVPVLHALGSALVFAATGMLVLVLMMLPVRRAGIRLRRRRA